MKQLDEFRTLLQDISRKLDNIGELLQRLVDAQEQESYSVTIIGDRDGWQDFKDAMNWTGQEGQND